jgi:pyrimidine-nucleoside phosphorylase
MSPERTADLTRAMLESGDRIEFEDADCRPADKHSTGGVGDKVSLVLAPLAAELGLYVPMMSGRGLGHTTGTLDKLEAIPGFRVQLALDEFRRILGDVGCAMIGQTAEIAPLDRRLYALRDVTATVPVIPLIAASIMSKKLAEGLTGLVLDVKVGGGAFIPEEERALDLARTMVRIGQGRGLPTHALLTAMDRPLGRAVGNGLETLEAIRCMRGEGPDDLRELVLEETAEMVVLGHPGTSLDEARSRARAALASGRALQRFARMVEAQGGDPSVVDAPGRLATAPLQRPVVAEVAGTVKAVSPRPLGAGVLALGGGRLLMGESIDLGVGFEVDVRVGDTVEAGQLLGRVHAADEDGARRGTEILRRAIRLEGEAERPRPLVSHRVTPADV